VAVSTVCESTGRPLVSVVIPTYNRQVYLRATLEHLLACGPPGMEVIVVDDASQDRTLEMLARDYPSVVAISVPTRRGPSSCRNIGMDVARGQYFLPLDSDCFVVGETLCWLWRELPGLDSHLLLSCRSWPERKRAVEVTPSRAYTARDCLLKTYGEVVPVLHLDSLRKSELRYPELFAGGEPLLLAQLAQMQPIPFVDRVVLEYRTDLSERISGADYQLRYPQEIARVFEAYLPFLGQLPSERARVREKAGVYLLLAGRRREAATHLLASLKLGRASALAFLAAGLLPVSWLRRGFLAYRRRQGSPYTVNSEER
jgi:hypothetical protein